MKKLATLTHDMIGNRVPKRNGTLAVYLSKRFLKTLGWRIVGDIPNIPQAVLLAVPHTSNVDGLYAIPTLLALNVDIKILGKKELFRVPVLSSFLHWAGIIPIDRDKKGSVLQANIDRFKTGKPLFLGLAPEGTRGYSDAWRTGFYYLAMGAGVPIIPVAMDYKTKEIRFLDAFEPTGDIDADLPKIIAMYKGVVPRVPAHLSQPLQDLKE